QRLPRLLVFLRAEGRILPLHHFQDVAELLALRGAFRLDRHGDDGFWKDNALQDNWGLRIAERVAGDRVTQADDADDVSRPGAFNLLAAISLNVPKLWDVFLLVFAGIERS